MSIYNGFATRKQETTYLKWLYYMFVILQSRAASSINGTNFDESKFEQKFEKLYDKISELDRHKYLHPRFSMCFTELADAYGLEAKHFQLRKHTRNSKWRKDNRVKYILFSISIKCIIMLILCFSFDDFTYILKSFNYHYLELKSICWQLVIKYEY